MGEIARTHSGLLQQCQSLEVHMSRSKTPVAQFTHGMEIHVNVMYARKNMDGDFILNVNTRLIRGTGITDSFFAQGENPKNISTNQFHSTKTKNISPQKNHRK